MKKRTTIVTEVPQVLDPMAETLDKLFSDIVEAVSMAYVYGRIDGCQGSEKKTEAQDGDDKATATKEEQGE